MYQTLDDLEYVLTQPKHKFYKFSQIFRELKVLWLIFTVLFLLTYLITNAQLVIDNINWEKDKEKIENLILDMDSLEDYSKLNEEVAKIINEATNWLKKKS